MTPQFSEQRLLTGQKIILNLKAPGKEINIEAIVIDANGLGQNQASIGIDLREMVKLHWLPQETFAKWIQSTNKESVKLPSGSTIKVERVQSLDGNEYFVGEVCKLSLLGMNPGEDGVEFPKGRAKAIHGFYSNAYKQKGEYTEADALAVDAWIQSQLMEILQRTEHLSPEFYSWRLGLLVDRLEEEASAGLTETLMSKMNPPTNQ